MLSSVLRETLAGLEYLRSRKGHLALMLIAASINLFLAPAFSLLPLLVQNDLGGDAMTLGWMTSAFGVGMIAGGIVLGSWGGFSRRIVTVLAGIVGLGAGVLVLGMAPAEPLTIAAAGLLTVGLMVPFCNGPIYAIMQTTDRAGLPGARLLPPRIARRRDGAARSAPGRPDRELRGSPRLVPRRRCDLSGDGSRWLPRAGADADRGGFGCRLESGIMDPR